MMEEYSFLYKISIWVIPIVLAVTLHEAAHGWVAWKLGDRTAFNQGRVTFNPIKHIDFFGTLVLPAILLLASGGKMSFGYAKPVPVNFWALAKPRRDMVLVALAGPGANLILAIIAVLLLHLVDSVPYFMQSWLAENLMMLLLFNLILCIFNMIPIPPLDGGRVAVGILPPIIAKQLERLERTGFGIILVGLFLLPWLGDQVGLDLNIFMWAVAIPAAELAEFMINITGVL
jgi:Zn-dependent protease